MPKSSTRTKPKKNSWGKGRGDNGFGYASDAYARAAFTEAYGVVL